MRYCAVDVQLVIVAAVGDTSSTNARHGVDPLVPSTCWPYGASVPSGRAQERLLPILWILPPSACTSAHISEICTRTWRLSLKGGSAYPLSVVGWPMDGAGDGVKMGTSRSLSEQYCFDLRARSRRQTYQARSSDSLRRCRCGSGGRKMEWCADRGYPVRPGHYHIPSCQSAVALQAPHCVQWMKRPCTRSSSACSKTVPQFPHR
jgi:hypothetical protein